jgi:hypothetical protein
MRPGYTAPRVPFSSGGGAEFEKGELSFGALAKFGSSYGKAGITGGKQEYPENVLNQYLPGR